MRSLFLRSKFMVLIAGVAAVAATGIVFSTGTATASAASTCTYDKTVKTALYGSHAVYSCNNYSVTPIYRNSSTSSGQVGTVHTGVNWVVCYVKGDNNPSPHGYLNDYWAYTLSDNNTWGYEPFTYVSQGSNWKPSPGVPACGGTAPVAGTQTASTPTHSAPAATHPQSPPTTAVTYEPPKPTLVSSTKKPATKKPSCWHVCLS